MSGVLDRKAAEGGQNRVTEAHVERAAGSPVDAPRRTRRRDGQTVTRAGLTRSLPASGCAYRPALVPLLFDELSVIEVWEHIADWYLDNGGSRRLARFVGATPITLHSLSLSVGSEATVETLGHAEQLADLVRASGVDHLSDHLAFSRFSGPPHSLTSSPCGAPRHSSSWWRRTSIASQSQLGVPLLLENPASPLDPGGDMSTAEFLNRLCARTGCEVLLDLENVRVNATNGLVDAELELGELDLRHVGGIHLVGGTDPHEDGPAFDAHSWPVRDLVMDWLDRVVPRTPRCRWVVLERDGRMEEAAEVRDDLRRVRQILGRSAASESAREEVIPREHPNRDESDVRSQRGGDEAGKLLGARHPAV